MLVYWESLVWSVIANGVVYVKYKAYKAKLMVLNCLGFLARPVSAMIPANGVATVHVWHHVTVLPY